MSGPTEEKKPSDTPFKQQRLRAWQPILSPQYVIACFVVIAALFIPIGAFVVIASDEVQLREIRYDDLFHSCTWSGPEKENAGCFSNPCTDPICYDKTKCGMLAKLPAECPRTFDKGFNSTLPEINQMTPTKCDPRCEYNFTFEITETMEAPVYFYYKLTKFYQNHRRYAKSRSDTQISGSSSGGADCDPLKKPGDIGNGTWCTENLGAGCGAVPITKCLQYNSGYCTQESDPQRTTGDLTYSPCGLVAWSKFNDSFILSYVDPQQNSSTTICDGDAFHEDGTPKSGNEGCSKDGIAWDADKDKKFKAPATGPGILTSQGFKADMDKCMSDGSCDVWSKQNALPFLYHGWYLWEPYHTIPRTLDEDFMVWMRTASLPTFRKLYRKINKPLKAGSYTLLIKHRFDVTGFQGEKYIVLSTITWIGGKNYFLGIAYITVGALCCILALGFTIKHVFFKTNRTEAMAPYQNAGQ